MRLVTFQNRSEPPRVGALLDDSHLLDLTAASQEAAWSSSMLSLIESGDAALAEARALVAQAPKGSGLPLEGVRLLAPIPRPPRMRACSLDGRHLAQATDGILRLAAQSAPDPEAAYQAAREAAPRQPLPAWYETPVYWFMDHFCVAGPDDKVTWPAYSNWVDFELEIAAVIGKPGIDVTAAAAPAHIFGYTIVNDLSCRDAQREATATGLSITAKGKDFEGSYPMGPCIVTADEIRHREMQASLRVNGELWATGTPRDAKWGFEDAIAYASRAARLIPGEIITSATVANCSGADLARKGTRGDCVELTVAGIGTLRTFIV